jgi:hypothetical protein
MLPGDPVLHRQIPVIQKIIQDETWLEGERRGCQVTSDDRVVRENVCRVILRVGHDLRESFTREDARNQVTVMSVTTAEPSRAALDWEI